MFRSNARRELALAFFGIAFAPGTALAVERSTGNSEQTGADTAAAAAAAATVTAPRLRAPLELQLPADAPNGVVTVSLSLSAEGVVTAVELVEGVRPDVDALVVEALKRAQLEPATRGGAAVAVRFLHRQPVSAPTPPPPAAKPKATTPLPAPSKHGTKALVPRGTAAPSAPNPALALEEEPEFAATATVEAPAHEPTRRVLRGALLRDTPGTRGDPVRAIELMPGVARPVMGFGNPLIRGAAWNESLSLIEGAPVPLLFHFGDINSVISPRLVDKVELIPGNFGAAYGRRVGGVVKVGLRDPAADRLHAAAELGTLDASALVEGPLAKGWSLALAARRSHFELFFDAVVPKEKLAASVAPSYLDYQGLLVHKQDGARFRLFAYGVRDALALRFPNPNQDDPGLRSALEARLSYHRLQFDHELRIAANIQQRVQLTVGSVSGIQRVAGNNTNYTGQELYFRSSHRFDVNRFVSVETGLDVAGMRLTGQYEGGAPPQAEGGGTGAEQSGTSAVRRLSGLEIYEVHPAAFVELAARPLPGLTLLPSLRVDYYDNIGASSVDPRLSGRYELSSVTTLKAGLGRYSQPPLYYEALPQLGNPQLDPYSAVHASAGVEQRLPLGFEVGIEGFHKWLSHRVVATPGGVEPRFVNDGTGRIFGGELSLRYQSERTQLQVAWTVSRSERQDRDEPTRLFDQDQTHIASIAASHALGAGYKLGARLRVISGNPRTPVMGAVYDGTIGQYRPIPGAVNSERDPLFYQLDVRAEKRWQLGPVGLTAFFELINATAAENPQGVRYSYDYAQSAPIQGFPLFPNLGFRGEL